MIYDIYNDLWNEISKYLPVTSIYRLSISCKKLNLLLKNILQRKHKIYKETLKKYRIYFMRFFIQGKFEKITKKINRKQAIVTFPKEKWYSLNKIELKPSKKISCIKDIHIIVDKEIDVNNYHILIYMGEYYIYSVPKYCIQIEKDKKTIHCQLINFIYMTFLAFHRCSIHVESGGVEINIKGVILHGYDIKPPLPKELISNRCEFLCRSRVYKNELDKWNILIYYNGISHLLFIPGLKTLEELKSKIKENNIILSDKAK